MRTVRRLENGHVTCLPKNFEDRRLCDSCGFSNACEVAKTPEIKVTSCKVYVYKIAFADAKGLSGEFNTLRLGSAWANRLAAGDSVALETRAGDHIGMATVESVLVGDKEAIIREHAKANHLLIDSDKTTEEAGDWMLKQMPNLYGNLIYKNNTQCTVIYMRRA